MKKLLVALVLVTLLGAAGAGVVVYMLQPVVVGEDGQKTTRLEQWLAERLRAIAAENLNTEFTFSNLQYEYPATVMLEDVRMTDSGIDIARALSITIEFTELPKIGKPIVIEKIHVEQPVLTLVSNADDALHGWSNLIRSRPAKTKRADNEASRPSTRPSDVFAIRTIEVDRASVRYESPNGPAMQLDGLIFDLNTDPDAAQRGVYSLDVALDHAALFTLNLIGALNIDTASLDIEELTLQTDLEPDRYEVLPPQLQRVVRKHSITGRLEVQVHGHIPLRDALQSDIALRLDLIDGFVAMGRYTLPSSR